MEENTIRLVSEALRTCIKALLAASEAMAAMDEELTKSTADVPVIKVDLSAPRQPDNYQIITFPSHLQSQEEW